MFPSWKARNVLERVMNMETQSACTMVRLISSCSYATAEQLAEHFTSCEHHNRTVMEDIPGVRDAFFRDSRVLGALAYTLARVALPRLRGIHHGL